MDQKLVRLILMMLIIVVSLLVWARVLPAGQEQQMAEKFSSQYLERFFDKDRVIDIYVTLAEVDFADMLENPMKEEYKLATAIVDGEKVANVGFRVKGNSSLNMVAGSDSKRFSFKLDFDQYISGQSLMGLTKLNLNNSVTDPSYMREYISYALLDQMGVPTPGFVYANVYVNGELLGLYLAVEAFEEPFLERYYGSDYGTLYKPEGQGSDLIYTDDERESYSGIAPVTEPKQGADAALLSMLKALQEGKDLDKYLNVDEILRYFAVNTALVSMDSYQGTTKHNYYLYEKDGVFSVLPWDYNMSFGGFNMGGGNAIELYIDQPVSGTTLEQRPLLGKLLAVEEYKDLYHQYLEEFINGPFTLETMSEEIERVAALIRPHLEQDPTKFYSMEQFEKALEEGSAMQNPVGEEQIAVDRNNPGQARPQGGDRMLQGDNAIGLVKFVRERVDNVAKQLRGELPTMGDATQTQQGSQMRFPGGEPGAGQEGRRAGGLGQRPPDGERLPEGMNQIPPGMEMGNFPPRDGAVPEGGFENMRGGGIPQSVEQARPTYLIGGSLALLCIAIVLVMRKRTKNSV